jgi:hypothetical protein
VYTPESFKVPVYSPDKAIAANEFAENNAAAAAIKNLFTFFSYKL